jgi:subtilase family serine protease
MVEPLESRALLSAAGLNALTARPQIAWAKAIAGQGYLTPAQVSRAYGLGQTPSHLPAGAGSAVLDGSGQTIAVITAYDDPAIAADLHVFDQQFQLPDPPSFKKVDQAGGGQYPPASADWAVETALDVQWAHAVAPGANILLVEAQSDNLLDLLTAVDYARRQPGVSVVSMSWGTSEFPEETGLDGYFTTPAGHAGVTFVSSAGDDGVPGCWPAFSPAVVAVGGTSLKTLGAAGTYRSESAWCHGGGGWSMFELEPGYQAQVQRSGERTIPDIAYAADPNNGFAVYDTLGDAGGWLELGGTSAGTPQWAGIFALVDQGRVLGHVGPLRSAPADLYRLPASAFHDVATGMNGFAAGPGYDLATGLGSPAAARLIPDLIASSDAVSAISPGRNVAIFAPSLPSPPTGDWSIFRRDGVTSANQSLTENMDLSPWPQAVTSCALGFFEGGKATGLPFADLAAIDRYPAGTTKAQLHPIAADLEHHDLDIPSYEDALA